MQRAGGSAFTHSQNAFCLAPQETWPATNVEQTHSSLLFLRWSFGDGCRTSRRHTTTIVVSRADGIPVSSADGTPRRRVGSFSKWSWPILGGVAHQVYASRLFLSGRKCIRPIVTIPFSSCLIFWWSIESKIFLKESLMCSRDRFSYIIFSPIYYHVHSSVVQYISAVQLTMYFDSVVIHPFFRNAKTRRFFKS